MAHDIGTRLRQVREANGLSQRALGKLRGEVHRYEGVPVVATYHPAALLRNPGWTRAAWDDLQLLRRVMVTGPTDVS